MLIILPLSLFGLLTTAYPAQVRNLAIDPTVADWARAAVERLDKAQVIWGISTGNFRGRDIATRTDLMVTLNRLRVGHDINSPRTRGRDVALFDALTPVGSERAMGLQKIIMLKDVDQGHGRVNDAWPLFDAGILQGDQNLYFHERQPLRRSELAMICARMIVVGKTQVNLDAAKAHFSDIAGDEWYFGAIIVACGAEVMRGYGDRMFRGSRAMTRNELAVTLDRLGMAMGWTRLR